jgi:hypothetical protein
MIERAAALAKVKPGFERSSDKTLRVLYGR